MPRARRIPVRYYLPAYVWLSARELLTLDQRVRRLKRIGPGRRVHLVEMLYQAHAVGQVELPSQGLAFDQAPAVGNRRGHTRRELIAYLKREGLLSYSYQEEGLDGTVRGTPDLPGRRLALGT